MGQLGEVRMLRARQRKWNECPQTVVDLLAFCVMVLLQMAHSSFPDSSFGGGGVCVEDMVGSVYCAALYHLFLLIGFERVLISYYS